MENNETNDELELTTFEKEVDQMVDKVTNINISNEIKNSFLDYSMSVIVARALPDVRDGLKPVHRRILYTFFNEGILSDKPHKKSATTCGKVMAYHPHGDAAIYDTMARMAQDFTYRYTLIDGKGAFGAPDGSSPAAARYTEARLDKISNELLRDINKDAVIFAPNYDEETVEPTVLPSRFPNILVNGNMGIAVGMATNIPPHNLIEAIDATIAYIDNPNISVLELMEYIKGPDFPTGGSILGNSGIKQAYDTGKGSIVVRAKVDIEEKNGKNKLIITETPYQVNYTNIIKRIAELVKNKQIEGIADLTDESALEGIRIVIDVKKDYNPNVLLNNLYKYTQLQTSYGINFLMLVDGQPKTLCLPEILKYYVQHQIDVVTRRTKFDLRKAEARAHVLEGLKIALDHIDDIIKTIKESNNDQEIIKKFDEKYGLTEIQSQAILEMRLRRLSGLERKKIEDELEELTILIAKLKEILLCKENILAVIKEEMLEIKVKFGDDRRTIIDMTAIEYIEDESLIPVCNMMVSLTNKGYIKRVPIDTYRSQNRGGVGVKGMTTNEEDFVEQLISCSTHDYLLLFSNKGKVYRIKCYEIPECSRQSKGLPIVNLLPTDKTEDIKSIIKIEKDEENHSLIFFTENGLVKRTMIKEFDSIRKNGKIAITLKEEDELISVKKTDGNDEIMMASNSGRMVRFNENEVRLMGRSASGVKGIELVGSKLIGAEIAKNSQLILVITEKGYGKKSLVEEYRLTHRGSKGVKALNITDKNGLIVAFKSVDGNEDVIMTTNIGIVIRLDVNKISTLKRNTQGVRLMNLKEGQCVTTVTLTDKSDDVIADEIVNNDNLDSVV